VAGILSNGKVHRGQEDIDAHLWRGKTEARYGFAPAPRKSD